MPGNDMLNFSLPVQNKARRARPGSFLERLGIAFFSLFLLIGLSSIVAAQDRRTITSEEVLEAEDFVQDLADRAIASLGDSSVPLSKRRALFAELANESFELNYIARFVLGRHWRSATPEQRTSYVDLFKDFLVETYTRRLTEYADEVFTVAGTKPGGRNDLIVSSKIIRNHGPDLPVDWRVRRFDGAFKIIDVKIEGVSMAITQRQEFSSVVHRDGLDGLIANLRDKTSGSRDKESANEEAANKEVAYEEVAPVATITPDNAAASRTP